MDPPIGFVPLGDAADKVGRKVGGSSWRSIKKIKWDVIVDAPDPAPANPSARPIDIIIDKLDPKVDRILKMIAAWCEADELPAAYRSSTGVNKLDCSVWHAPSWRNYFQYGTIDLKLPLLDDNGRPVPDGRTTRCRCEIFVRQQDLDRLIGGVPGRTTSRATGEKIAKIVADYHSSLPVGATPSQEVCFRFARDAGLTGFRNELRDEYRKQLPGQVVGRPRKNPSKNLP